MLHLQRSRGQREREGAAPRVDRQPAAGPRAARAGRPERPSSATSRRVRAGASSAARPSGREAPRARRAHGRRRVLVAAPARAVRVRPALAPCARAGRRGQRGDGAPPRRGVSGGTSASLAEVRPAVGAAVDARPPRGAIGTDPATDAHYKRHGNSSSSGKRLRHLTVRPAPPSGLVPGRTCRRKKSRRRPERAPERSSRWRRL